jgi:hypothetical protein
MVGQKKRAGAKKRGARKPKKAAKAAPKKAAKRGRAARKARAPVREAAPARPSISRAVIEEILIYSAKSPEPLSDTALAEIAIAADLEPERVLEVHQRLAEAYENEPSAPTVIHFVELWEPED